MGLSGRPNKLSSRVREGARVRRIVESTEDSVESVPVTLAEAQEGNAGVSDESDKE